MPKPIEFSSAFIKRSRRTDFELYSGFDRARQVFFFPTRVRISTILTDFYRKFSGDLCQLPDFKNELETNTCRALGSSRTLKHVCAEFG